MTEAALHWMMMEGNLMQQNAGVGGIGVGGAAATAATPTTSTASGKQQFAGRRSTVWSALTDFVKISGPAVTTQEFSKKLYKWKADVGGDSTKCATFKIQ